MLDAAVEISDSSSLFEEEHWDFWTRESWEALHEPLADSEVETRRVDGRILEGIFRKATAMFPPEGAKRLVFRTGFSVNLRQTVDNSQNALTKEQLSESFTGAKDALFSRKRQPSTDSLPGGEVAAGHRAAKKPKKSKGLADAPMDPQEESANFLGVFDMANVGPPGASSSRAAPASPEEVLSKKALTTTQGSPPSHSGTLPSLSGPSLPGTPSAMGAYPRPVTPTTGSRKGKPRSDTSKADCGLMSVARHASSVSAMQRGGG